MLKKLKDIFNINNLLIVNRDGSLVSFRAMFVYCGDTFIAHKSIGITRIGLKILNVIDKSIIYYVIHFSVRLLSFFL